MQEEQQHTTSELEEVTSNATKTIVATTHYTVIVDCYCWLAVFVESTIEIMKL